MAANLEKEPLAPEGKKDTPAGGKSPEVTHVTKETKDKVTNVVGTAAEAGGKTERTTETATTATAATPPIIHTVHHYENHTGKEDVQDIVPESLSAGVRVGVPAAAVAYVAQATGSLPYLGLSAAGAALGAIAGKKFFPKSEYAPYLGGALGAVATVPTLSAGMSAVPAFNLGLYTPGWPWLAHGLITVPCAIGGAYLGHRWSPKSKKAPIFGGIAGAIAPLALSNIAPSIMSSTFVGTSVNIASYAPATVLGVGSLAQIASLGLVAGAAGGALYGLGKIEGWMWGRSKTNSLWKNFGRGLISPFTIPAGLLYHSSRFGVSEVGKTLRATKEGIVRIFTGNSPAVRAVTSPVWWPMRSTYRFGRGMVKGLYNGLTRSEPSATDKAHGVFGTLGRAVPYAAGRMIRSPLDAGRWLMSPGWSSRK